MLGRRHGTTDQKVGGSNPSGRAIEISRESVYIFLGKSFIFWAIRQTSGICVFRLTSGLDIRRGFGRSEWVICCSGVSLQGKLKIEMQSFSLTFLLIDAVAPKRLCLLG